MEHLQEKKSNVCLLILEEMLEAKYGFEIRDDGFDMEKKYRRLWGHIRLRDFLSDDEMLALNEKIVSNLKECEYDSSNVDISDYGYTFLCFLSNKGKAKVNMEVFLLLLKPEDDFAICCYYPEKFATPESVIKTFDTSLILQHDKVAFPADSATPPFVDANINVLDDLLDTTSLKDRLSFATLLGLHTGVKEPFSVESFFRLSEPEGKDDSEDDPDNPPF